MSNRTSQSAGGLAPVAAAAALLAGVGPAAAQARSHASTVGGARVVSVGAWGKAIEAPGIAALNWRERGGPIGVVSLGGQGTAGGTYTDSAGHTEVFVASEVNAIWGKAIEVPGTAALNTAGGGLAAVSCSSAGTCAAGGNYTDASGHGQVFVAGQVNGIWGKAKEVPGIAALNTGGLAQMIAVSCAPAGTCAAGGFYGDNSGLQAFVVSQT